MHERTRLHFALAAAAALGLACAAPNAAPVCERYTSCVRALDEAQGTDTDLDRFDPGGACWGSEEQGKVCEQACERGLAWLGKREDITTPEACTP